MLSIAWRKREYPIRHENGQEGEETKRQEKNFRREPKWLARRSKQSKEEARKTGGR